MFPERKFQVMFSSYLSQDVSAVVRFRYVSATEFLISLLNLCNENKSDHGFVHGFYYFDEIETLGNCTSISMKF